MRARKAFFSIALCAAWLGGIAACGQPNEPLKRGDRSATGAGGGGDSAGAGGSTVTGGNGGSEGGSAGASGGAAGNGGAGSTGGSGGAGGTSSGGAGGNGNGAAGRGGGAGGTAGGSAGTGAGGGGAGGTAGGSAGTGAGGGGAGGTAGGGAGTGGNGGGAGGTTGGSAGAGGSSGTNDGGGTAETLHFSVYGDTRTGSATHQSVIDQIAKHSPQLVIHSGDLWDGYTQAKFTSILTKNPNIGSLLDSGLFVVSRGNHETLADFLAFRPSLSRGNASERFSYTVGNSFFVVLGMDPSKGLAFLEGELKKPEAAAARWRFVQSHYSVYSGGTTHGASGIPSIEKVCDTYHVAVYWSGHDHIYERSHQVYGGQVVDKGDDLSLDNGTVYVVSGGGGAPLYGVAPITTTHFQASVNNYVDVVAAANRLTIKAYKLDGSVIDSFVIAQ